MKHLIDNNAHPLVKGAVGTCGGLVTWISSKIQLAQVEIANGGIEAVVKAIGFYGGAVVVILTISSLLLDNYRKWKNRNRP